MKQRCGNTALCALAVEARARGISYGELCEKIIELSLKERGVKE